MILVLGADHGGYVKRMEALARAVSDNTAKNTIYLVQLVKLFRNGEPVRMSKRAGEFVTLRDVVDEVGRDPVRFMMLYRKNDAPLDFRLCQGDRAVERQPGLLRPVCLGALSFDLPPGERNRSAYRQAFAARPVLAQGVHLLTDDSELALIRKLAEYPRLVESAAMAREPHRDRLLPL